MKKLEPDCDKCFGEKTKDCPDNCLTGHIRYIPNPGDTSVIEGWYQWGDSRNAKHHYFRKTMIRTYEALCWGYGLIREEIRYADPPDSKKCKRCLRKLEESKT